MGRLDNRTQCKPAMAKKDVRLSKTMMTDENPVGQKRWAEKMKGKEERWATKGGQLHFIVVIGPDARAWADDNDPHSVLDDVFPSN